MDLDAEIRAANDRVQAAIDRRYDRIRRWWIDTYNDARRANGYSPLIILVGDHHCVSAPARYRCPECGARMYVEIESWESFTGRPEEALVFCEVEDIYDDNAHARPDWSAWEAVNLSLLRWARSNVRVL